MRFLRDSCVTPVLDSSCILYTLRICARDFLALAKKSLFLEAALITATFHFPRNNRS